MRALLRELRAALGFAARPAFLVSVWVCFMCVAAALAFLGGPGGTVVAAAIFAVAALLGGFVLGTAIPPLLADARTLCLPGRFSVLSYTGSVIGIFCLAGVVLPGAWLGWHARSGVPAMLIASGALAGLLIPRMPRATVAVIWVVGHRAGRWRACRSVAGGQPWRAWATERPGGRVRGPGARRQFQLVAGAAR